MTGTVTVEGATPRFDVLVFSRTTGFRHAEAIAAGRTAITRWARPGTSTSTSARTRALHRRRAAQFEVVVFLDTDGEGILNPAQRTAFERWTQRGGGIVSIHADANADRNWAWKGDMMGGAWFLDHPAATSVPACHGQPRRRHPPRHGRRAGELGARGRVVQLHRRARRTSTSCSARREHLRRAGRSDGVATTTRSRGARLRRRAPLHTALGHHGHLLGRARLQGPHPRRRRMGVRRRGRATAARARGPPDRRVVRQGHARRHHREPDGDRRRRRRRRLLRRAGRHGQALRPGQPRGPQDRHDPGPPRNENGLLGITLDPDFATNRWLYLFYSAQAPESSASRASRWRRTGRST